MLLQGTNLLNFMGRYIYVADGAKGFDAVAVAEHDEPPAIIGSYLQRSPTRRIISSTWRAAANCRKPTTTSETFWMCSCAANISMPRLGKGGFRVYDVANIDNKNFSERTITAPVSPLGQRLYVRTKYATAVASPSTQALDPARTRNPVNEEQSHSSALRLFIRRGQI